MLVLGVKWVVHAYSAAEQRQRHLLHKPDDPPPPPPPLATPDPDAAAGAVLSIPMEKFTEICLRLLLRCCRSAPSVVAAMVQAEPQRCESFSSPGSMPARFDAGDFMRCVSVRDGGEGCLDGKG